MVPDCEDFFGFGIGFWGEDYGGFFEHSERDCFLDRGWEEEELFFWSLVLPAIVA